MKFLPTAIAAGLACLSLASAGRTDEIEWAPEANMDRQLFPSLLIATATQRPPDDDQEAEEPNPYMLGDPFGLVGVLAEARADGIMPISYSAAP